MTLHNGKLLFLSPVMPSASGSGRKMRAYNHLVNYAKKYDILLITTDSTPPDDEVIPLVQNIIHIESQRHLKTLLTRQLRKLPKKLTDWYLPDQYVMHGYRRFKAGQSVRELIMHSHAVLIYRIYMIPVLNDIMDGAGLHKMQLLLDIDDIESLTNQRIAVLARENGYILESEHFKLLSRTYEIMEDYWLPRVESAFVCSAVDQSTMAQRFPDTRINVIPNRYTRLPDIKPSSQEGDKLRLLFVGTLEYLPNQDALHYFCSAIMPALEHRYTGDIVLDVAGSTRYAEHLPSSEQYPYLNYHGYVNDLSKIYASSHIVICPLRAGGGTRIKILEAVAHKRPVVTTSMGNEGLMFDHNQVLIADTADAFADKICRLVDESDLSETLVKNAYDVLRRHYLIQTD